MTEASVVQIGCQVSLLYKITLEDGTVADTNFGEAPISFKVGDGTLQEGLEMALLGQAKGHKESIKIGPEIAFGYPDENAIVNMAKTDFPADLKVEVGSVIEFNAPNGEIVPGAIIDDLGDEYKVDLNHPLAGHELDFEFEILDVTCHEA